MPSNGSSRNSSRGAGSSAAASDSFLRMPCEKSVTSVFAAPSSAISRSRSADRCVAVAGVDAVHVGDEGQRLARRQPIEQREILGHDADAPLHRDGIGQRIDAEDAHRAGGRPEQAGQALDGGGLAGAVRSEEAVEAAGRHREIDAVDGAELTEVAGEAVRLDRQVHARRLIAVQRQAITAARELRHVVRLPRRDQVAVLGDGAIDVEPAGVA